MIRILNVPSLYSALYKAVDFCKENEKENIEIIVPDKLSLFMEKFLFERMNICASFNIKVSTLNRFAKKSCVVDKEKQISKVGSILLIHKILNDNIDKLEVLKSKAYSFSYAEDIFKTIGQFKASKITFEEMKNYNNADAQLNGKIKDLALVYEEYEKQKAGLLDASDVFLMSTFHVADGKENSKLLFVGFDDFTAIEYAIIERLACVTEVYVLNNHSKAGNKHIYNHEIVSQLKNIAYINELPFSIEDCEIYGSELKQFLQNNIYAIKNEKFILKDDVVKIFSGNNVQSEIEFVARDIRNKILNGERFDNFGVAVYNLDGNSNKIKEIFEKYEINYYIDSETSITKSILYKFFLSIFKYNLDGYNLSNLIDIINSPFCKLSKDEKRLLVQRLISINFRGKITESLDLNLDEETKNYFVKFVNNLTFDNKIDAFALVEKLKNLESMLSIDDILNELSLNDVNNSVLINKSKDVIYSLFDDILKFNKDIDVNSFYDIFAHASSVVKINNLPLSLDAVKVVDANNTIEVFNDFYIINVTHENAPNLKNDCGIILDNEIEKLSFSNKLSPTIAHINKLSKLRLFNTLMLFENELTITYSNSQSEVIKEIQNKLQVETKLGVINLEPFSNFEFDNIALSNWDYIEFLTKYDKNNIKINEKTLKNKEFSSVSNENLKIFDDLSCVSATTLENYFKCPFYGFLTNTMKIKPRLETEILSLDIGNVLHEIMYKYYKLNKRVDDIYDFCKNEVFKCVEKEERLKLNANSPILINLIDEAVRVINAVNYIDENSLFEAIYFEKEFKNENALKLNNISIIGKVDRIDVYNDMFRIIDYKTGKADASLKELYYGNKLQLFLYACAMEKVLGKNAVGTFYLPLHNAYTKELSNTYSLKGFYLAEDFVVRAFDKRLTAGTKSDIVNVRLSSKDKVAKTIGYKELEINSLNDLKNYSKMVAEQAVAEIKSGYIAPKPSEVSKSCEFCPYVHICMKNSNGIEYRKANKITLDSFKEANND